MNTLPLTGISNPLPLQKVDTHAVAQAGNSFADLLSNSINQVNKTELKGDMAIEQLHTREARNLHEVMIATEEADIAIRMLVQMRNKALEAYNEIMRLQI